MKLEKKICWQENKIFILAVKSVARAPDGFNKIIFRPGRKFFAQAVYVYGNSRNAAIRFIVPEPLAKLFLAKNAVGILHEKLEHIEFFLGKNDFLF